MQQKTKLEIINETAEYYSTDIKRRGIDGFSCEYLTKHGKMCAVGRCMEEPHINMTGVVDEGIGLEVDEGDIIHFNVEELLKEEYRGHSIDFWKDLQEFHDAAKYWTNKGLSKAGKDQLKDLLNKYADESL